MFPYTLFILNISYSHCVNSTSVINETSDESHKTSSLMDPGIIIESDLTMCPQKY